jgi:hypothetical protein
MRLASNAAIQNIHRLLMFRPPCEEAQLISLDRWKSTVPDGTRSSVALLRHGGVQRVTVPW